MLDLFSRRGRWRLVVFAPPGVLVDHQADRASVSGACLVPKRRRYVCPKALAVFVENNNDEGVCVSVCVVGVPQESFPTEAALWTQRVTFRGQPQKVPATSGDVRVWECSEPKGRSTG